MTDLTSPKFRSFLRANIRHITEIYGTPFHIYDAGGIMATGERMYSAFQNGKWGVNFNNFFAVKALPNPHILRLMKRSLGFGFDCSSVSELILARDAGATPDQIMFTSNNTSDHEFDVALSSGGCILNLDDITYLPRLKGRMPERICFRYNPGKARTGNSIIGNPYDAKYGITRDQVLLAYSKARRMGVERFGIHTMVCSNTRKASYIVDTVRMLLELCGMLKHTLGIKLEFINIGGGFGIPYRPTDKSLNIEWIGREVGALLHAFSKKHGFMPDLYTECGRYVTGPHGVLVSRVITDCQKYHRFIGVDTGMPALMRPAIYDAYHHIEVLDPQGRPRSGPRERMHVVGSICENCDRLTDKKGRMLPRSTRVGDIILTYCTGAHASAMGFNYNGRTRPKALWHDGFEVQQILREETIDDLHARFV